MSGLKLLGQPKPFYLIALIELWERFGYYGVQALVVVFMVKHLGYTDKAADILFTGFAALAYLLPSLGGYIGDHYFGTKRTLMFGAFVLTIGYAMMSIPSLAQRDIILPMAVIATGNGLFKANPSSLLSKLYERLRTNSDSGFTLYYMAINIGATSALTVTPIVSAYFGWYYGFAICAVGLILAIISFYSMSHLLQEIGSPDDFKPLLLHRIGVLVLVALAMVGVCYWLLSHATLMSILLGIGALILFGFYFYFMKQSDSQERKGMLLFIFLFLEGIAFFVLYYQMPTSMTLFALRNVNPSILGIPVEPASFQALNSIWIILLSPILAIIYQRLDNKGIDLTLPSKFTLGMYLCAAAYFFLVFGAKFAHNGVVNSGWVVLFYGLQSAGELLISALGLSLASRFIPQRYMGFVMGLWFLCTSIASIIGGRVASVASIPKNISTDAIKSLPIYTHLFYEIGIATLVIALVFTLILYPLVKLARSAEHGSQQQ